MNKKFLVTILTVIAFFLFIDGASAVIQLNEGMRPENLPTFDVSEATQDSSPETAGTNTLIFFIGNLVSQFLLFAGAITIIFMIVAGANYIFAFGKDQLIEKGKKGMVWSLVGLIIIMLSYAIVQGAIQIILQVDESAN